MRHLHNDVREYHFKMFLQSKTEADLTRNFNINNSENSKHT